jgi:hypothetical protein
MKNVIVLFFFSVLYFSCSAQGCIYPAIDSNYNVKFTCRGSMQINGKIDDTSTVLLTSIDSDIVITGKIDRNSKVTITAKNGNVTISLAQK